MALNPKYVISQGIQQPFVDRTTGLPLSGGLVYFYSDVNRNDLKSVYTLQGDQANYTYVALPNPLTLGLGGTPVDIQGNDIAIYYYPYSLTDSSEQELYFIKVFSSTGVPQETRQAWPGPSETGSNTTTDGTINLVPNGQMLAHTNLPNNLLVANSNVIAQGGISIELPGSITSTNTLSWAAVQPSTIPEDPRYVPTFTVTNASGAETFKNIRVKFDDVFKFSTPGVVYQFGFWADSSVTLPITIETVKYFGTMGGSTITTVIAVDEILTTGGFYNYTIDFTLGGFNDVDTIANNDFVAIDIALPTNVNFSLQFSDFVLVPGSMVISGFPVQTDADMLTRGIMGWVDTPNPNGADLFLPPVLTQAGMKWDYSSIGRIETYPYTIVAPSSSSATTNLITCDGSSYISSAYSYLGIPYSRLGQVLIAKSSIANTPLYGTGANYATAYAAAGNTSLLRITVNSSGTGSTAASAGTSGFTVGSIVTYGGSSTGSATLHFSAYSNVANTVMAVGDFTTPNAAATAGTSGFTVSTLNNFTGLLAQQYYAITVLCVAASALAAPSSPGLYFTFSNSTTSYYMWFQITNESDPAPGGTGIQVNLDSGYTAQDVANIVRETMNAYQISTVSIGAKPTAGQYFLFSSNPASSVNYYVWYTVNGLGSDPAIGGAIGIPVAIVTADTTATTTTKTLAAINAYQFATPNFAGMFLRGYDPTGLWDQDSTTRWSSISGLSGAKLGTFEYSQLESHVHPPLGNNFAATTGVSSVSAGSDLTGVGSNTTTGTTGGTETRPVNAYVNYAIRY